MNLDVAYLNEFTILLYSEVTTYNSGADSTIPSNKKRKFEADEEITPVKSKKIKSESEGKHSLHVAMIVFTLEVVTVIKHCQYIVVLWPVSTCVNKSLL